jgi:hypothetical protein
VDDSLATSEQRLPKPVARVLRVARRRVPRAVRRTRLGPSLVEARRPKLLARATRLAPIRTLARSVAPIEPGPPREKPPLQQLYGMSDAAYQWVFGNAQKALADPGVTLGVPVPPQPFGEPATRRPPSGEPAAPTPWSPGAPPPPPAAASSPTRSSTPPRSSSSARTVARRARIIEGPADPNPESRGYAPVTPDAPTAMRLSRKPSPADAPTSALPPAEAVRPATQPTPPTSRPAGAEPPPPAGAEPPLPAGAEPPRPAGAEPPPPPGAEPPLPAGAEPPRPAGAEPPPPAGAEPAPLARATSPSAQRQPQRSSAAVQPRPRVRPKAVRSVEPVARSVVRRATPSVVQPSPEQRQPRSLARRVIDAMRRGLGIPAPEPRAGGIQRRKPGSRPARADERRQVARVASVQSPAAPEPLRPSEAPAADRTPARVGRTTRAADPRTTPAADPVLSSELHVRRGSSEPPSPNQAGSATPVPAPSGGAPRVTGPASVAEPITFEATPHVARTASPAPGAEPAGASVRPAQRDTRPAVRPRAPRTADPRPRPEVHRRQRGTSRETAPRGLSAAIAPLVGAGPRAEPARAGLLRRLANVVRERDAAAPSPTHEPTPPPAPAKSRPEALPRLRIARRGVTSATPVRPTPRPGPEPSAPTPPPPASPPRVPFPRNDPMPSAQMPNAAELRPPRTSERIAGAPPAPPAARPSSTTRAHRPLRPLARQSSDARPSPMTAGAIGGDAGGDSDSLYDEVLRRVRQEQEQLGQLIDHPF